MTHAYITKPAKTAMQSGQAHLNRWKMTFKSRGGQYVDPVMGWTGSTTTAPQVILYFDCQEDAVAYATKNQLSYTVAEPLFAKIRPKSYGDHFKALRQERLQ